MRLNTDVHDKLIAEFHRDGFIVLRQHFSKAKLQAWADAFRPLLDRHIAGEGDDPNRGSQRYYVTLPFSGLYADPDIYDDDDIVALCDRLVGPAMVMCQLAVDTPLLGSDYQAVHRDAMPLFPEEGLETPSFQLAVNFPLCDVTPENGPLELARGTHRMTREEGMAKLDSGEIKLEPLFMELGDVIIRDVRHLHRGTPNRSPVPRPMVVIGYSRKWLYRPEVSIRVPRSEHAKLSDRARLLLRFNPVVDDEQALLPQESYREFAY